MGRRNARCGLARGLLLLNFYVDKALAYLDRAQRQDAPFCCSYRSPRPIGPCRHQRLGAIASQGSTTKAGPRPGPRGFRAWGSAFPPWRRPRAFLQRSGPGTTYRKRRGARRPGAWRFTPLLIAHMDAELGRLFAALEASGADENTVVLFLSDNGPEGNDVMAVADNATWVPKTFDLSYEAMGAPGGPMSASVAVGATSAPAPLTATRVSFPKGDADPGAASLSRGASGRPRQRCLCGGDGRSAVLWPGLGRRRGFRWGSAESRTPYLERSGRPLPSKSTGIGPFGTAPGRPSGTSLPIIGSSIICPRTPVSRPICRAGSRSA